MMVYSMHGVREERTGKDKRCGVQHAWVREERGQYLSNGLRGLDELGVVLINKILHLAIQLLDLYKIYTHINYNNILRARGLVLPQRSVIRGRAMYVRTCIVC